MQSVRNILTRFPVKSSSDTTDVKTLMERRAERYNASPGNLNADGLFDCKKCLNRGNFMRITDDGMIHESVISCSCMKVRRSIWNMKASGLEATIRKSTFELFVASEDWQKQMAETAKAYVAEGFNGGDWLFVGGCVGSGKTHICTAASRELLLREHELLYMSWVQSATKIKAVINNEEEYSREVSKLKQTEVLYIDDFLKPVHGAEPSAADLKLAYEIINARYAGNKPLIMSSERSVRELIEIDEAIGSRIYEKSKNYSVTLTGNDKNFRLHST